MEELLRRRIKVFSDDDGGLGVVLGGLLLRSVYLSSASDLVWFLSVNLGRSFRDPLDLLRLLFLPLFGAIGASVPAAAVANAAEWILFLVYLLALAMGIDLGCSPGGFGFRASDFITGGGLAAGLLLRRQGVGASFVSGKPAVVRLEFAPLLPLLARLLISVQRFTSILVGPRWWLLQLNQGLESAIGGSGGVGVGGGDRPGDERKKMNRSPRDFLVIFFFFLYLVEKGDVLRFTLIYLPLLQKKTLLVIFYFLLFFYIFVN